MHDRGRRGREERGIQAEPKKRYGLNGANLSDTPEEMLERERLDGILIGTRCSLHTEMALKVTPTGIPLFLEKPVALPYDLFELVDRRGRMPYRSLNF